jgi:hypothetical protein
VLDDYEGDELKVVELCAKHGIRVKELYYFLAMRPDVQKRRARGFVWCPPRGGRQVRSLGGIAKVLPNPDLDDAVRDYQAGVKIRTIRLTYRISCATLYNELAIRNVPMRGK